MKNPDPTITIRLVATIPGRKPISIHAEAEIDGGIAGAFDRLIGPLVAELRKQVVGDTT